MAKFYDHINEAQRNFIEKQLMFFVGTAPLETDARINVSPKGLDSFRVISDKKVAYMDLIGSGNETSAHTLQNSRITLMFCAFEGAPNILRIYGKGSVILPVDELWEDYAKHFEILANTRQIIVTEVESVQTSCGWGVPIFEHKGWRDQFGKWTENKGEQGLKDYIKEKNVKSIDGLATDWAKKLT